MNRPDSDSEVPEDADKDASEQLLDSIVDEFTRQIRAGVEPSVADFQKQYPQLHCQLGELLGSIAMIEQLKSTSAESQDKSKSRDRIDFPMPDKIGEYKIVSELGRGGMGVVYLGSHQTLGRKVAIKVLPPSLATSADRVDRFRSEAQAAARLHHTNIVGVFGVGQNDSFHYYVMDFVQGRGLDDLVRERTGSLSKPTSSSIATRSEKAHFRWAARVGADLADALAYAHQQGVLHRDLKPANFLLGDDGIVRITDFGLAKYAGSDIHLTKTGDLIGTPQYLAPESLKGQYDARSEVYCLGLTLYELICSKPAFEGGSPAEVLGNITHLRPLNLRKVDSKIPLDLSTVIEKAIAREPEARYENAESFRDDLLAFSEGRAISARRASSLQHALRWARSNPLAAGLSGLSVALLVLVAVATSIGYWSTHNALGKLQEQTKLLHEQQTATADALSQAIESKNQANESKVKIAEEFARAEANVAISMEAFDEMFRQMISQGTGDTELWEIDGFRELTGMEMSLTEADTEFLQKLLGFYRQFAEQNADNVDLAAELARAYRRMGNIYQLIDQPDQAIEAYREAVGLYQWVSLADPDATNARLAAFETNEELSMLLEQVE
jgi:serine/threonine protein kinase